MKYLASLLFFMVFLQNKSLNAQISPFYMMYVVQDADSFNIPAGLKNEITLKPKPFAFMFKLVNMTNIELNSSHKNGIYDTPFDSSFRDCEMVGINTGAGRNEYNSEKNIAIYEDGDGFSHWFYSNTQKHRFDSTARMIGDTVVVTRTIESFWYVPKYAGKPVSKDKKDLYITVFRNDAEPCKAINQVRIPDRRFLKIKFEK